MRYEITIALRYLFSKQSVREPTIIGLLTIAGLALSTGMMIIVLAVFAGFEGDLRDKILGTHAHVLVTGPDEDVVKDPDPVVDAIRESPQVTGVSPFVESEVMIASSTNYSGMVVRGLNAQQEMPASDFNAYLIEGDLTWLNDSKKAFSVREPVRWDGENPTLDEIDELQRQIEKTQEEIRRLRDQDGAATPKTDNSSRGADRTSDPPAVLSPSPRENALRTGSDSLDVRAQTDADDALMPDLPAPPSSKAEASEDALMPDLPAPPSSKAETDEDTLMP